MRLPLLAVLLVLPGCLDAEEPPAGGTTPDAREAPSAERANATPTAAGGMPAPVLPVGRAWTYQAALFYNPDEELTIVVSEVTPGGYRFSAGAQDDLVHHALWGNEWFGPHRADLGADGYAYKPFDFPLVDGKSWAWSEKLTVTAKAADVRTPAGIEPGFVIEGATERVNLRYAYAPSVGYYVDYLFEVDGVPREALRLVRMDEGKQDWVWFELGDVTVVPDPHEPHAFEVPAGFDEVLVSAGGLKGSRATVVPPGGAGGAWQQEFPAQDETWAHGVLPATEGRWVASVQGRPSLPVDPPAPPPASPVGWAYMHVAPVKWVRHLA